MQDEMYMARALKLAARGRFTTHPNPNVGCVIVKDGEIVGEGFHYRAGEPHAEVHALRMAGEKARGATAYVTLEPCSHHGRTPPCCDALIAAGVSRVVAAMQDPNPQVAGRGLYRLQQAGIEVSHGLMMNEAEALNKGFLKRMRTGFPLGAAEAGRLAGRPHGDGQRRKPVDHLPAGATRRAASARPEPCHPDQQRHRAGGRSGADRALAGAERRYPCALSRREFAPAAARRYRQPEPRHA